MAITLSTSELAALTRAANLLASPLLFANVDYWRSAVNRELRQLLGADSAGFLLPVDDGPLMYSDEHDSDSLARYPDLHPPPLADGSTIWERLITARVSTMPTAYGGDVRRYLDSAYYNEYAAPNGARDTLCAMLPILGNGPPDPRRVVSLQLWRDDLGGHAFGERERCQLGLVLPSLSAGVDLVLRWHRERERLLQTIDALGQAVLVCDLGGREAHQTPALTAALAADPEAATLRSALLGAAAALGRIARRASDGDSLFSSPPASEVRTAVARYAIRATIYGTPAQGDAMLLVALDRLTTPAPSADELRRKFALTPAESRVALLLARGASNLELAGALGVRACTARRHTERVLQKLGVSSRAAVGPRIS